MPRLFLLSVCVFVSVSSIAQLQASIWYFGENAGLDFRNGEPVPLIDGALSTIEGSASIADTSGNLLFYTDGVTVYNRLHQVMPNGQNLWGSYTTTQTLIVPKPGSDPIFYVFTASPQFDYIFGQGTDSVGFHYSVVDMSYNAGLGEVTQKNILLFKNTTEKVTAVHHANGKDIWVVAHEWGNNNFRSYLVTENGIDTTSVITSIGQVHTGGGENNGNALGSLKLSPNGDKLALVIYRMNTIEIFKFKHQNGRITAFLLKLIETGNPGFYNSAEFSADSKFLYYSHSNGGCGVNDPDNPSEIWQYSFENNKSVKVGEFVGALFSLQLALDGKIYITRCNDITSDSDFMAVINYPNRPGVACNFIDKAVSLNGRKNTLGLPNFIQSYFLFKDPVFDLPNVFTPNGDLYNPVFKPFPFENILDANMKIINRWGQEVFYTTNVAVGWDGGDSPPGTYYWLINYEGKNGKLGTQKGWVQLIR